MYAEKIAVLVRDRHAEALRTAVGLTIQGDAVDVFIMSQEIDLEDPSIAPNLEMLAEVGVRIISHTSGSTFAVWTPPLSLPA